MHNPPDVSLGNLGMSHGRSWRYGQDDVEQVVLPAEVPGQENSVSWNHLYPREMFPIHSFLGTVEGNELSSQVEDLLGQDNQLSVVGGV